LTSKVKEKALNRLTHLHECGLSSYEDVDGHLQELQDLAKSATEKKGIRRLSRMFKALGDESRLSILRLLQKREMCVCEIMIALEMTQPTASHHLGILERAGLVRERRDGRWVFYSIPRLQVKSLLEMAEKVPMYPN